MRESYVSAMQSGKSLCFWFGDSVVDMRNYDSKDFPIDLLFDFKLSREREVYL